MLRELVDQDIVPERPGNELPSGFDIPGTFRYTDRIASSETAGAALFAEQRPALLVSILPDKARFLLLSISSSEPV
jgi:hypothetical protein